MAVAIHASNSISKHVGLLLSTIFKVAEKIRSTVKRMKNNATDSHRLSDRVDRIVNILKRKPLQDFLSEPINKLLESFEKFLRKCQRSIEKFVNAGSFKRILRNEDYCHEFSKMHEELTWFENDLILGMLVERTSVIQRSTDCTEQVSHKYSLISCFYFYNKCFNFFRIFDCSLIKEAMFLKYLFYF